MPRTLSTFFLQAVVQPCICMVSFGGVAKWPKATVCKTVIRRFESDRRLSFQDPDIPRQPVPFRA